MSLPRHIPPRRPGNFWERVQSWGIFGIVLVGCVGLGMLSVLLFAANMGLAFIAGALGL